MKINPNLLQSFFQNMWYDNATDSFVSSGNIFPDKLINRVNLIEKLAQSEPDLPKDICSALSNVCHLLRESTKPSISSFELFRKHIESLAFLCSLNHDLVFTSETGGCVHSAKRFSVPCP